MIGLTFYSTNQVSQINDKLVSINKVNSVKQRYAINYRGSVHDRAIAIRDVTMLPTIDQRNVALKEIETLAAAYTKNKVNMTEMINSEIGATDTELSILAEIDGIQAKTDPLVTQIIELQNSGEEATARSILLEQAAPLFVDWLGAINKFIDFQENLNQNVGQSVDAAVGGFQYLALSMLGIAIVIGVSVAFFTAHSITKPLSELQKSLGSMSEGNLEGNPKLEVRKDEVGTIAITIAKLRDTMELKAKNEADEQAKRSLAENKRHELEAKKQNELSEQTQNAVDALADGLQKLAEGDLTTRLSEPFIDSLDRLRVDFNAATSKLCVAMGEVSTNARTISSASQEIQSASLALSK